MGLSDADACEVWRRCHPEWGTAPRPVSRACRTSRGCSLGAARWRPSAAAARGCARAEVWAWTPLAADPECCSARSPCPTCHRAGAEEDGEPAEAGVEHAADGGAVDAADAAVLRNSLNVLNVSMCQNK